MAVTQKVTLYNNKFTVPPVINAVQNDTDRQVEAYFGDFTLQVGMTGVLSFIRSDRTHYEVSATLDTATNTATAELDQALTQAGVTQAQLKITDSGNVGSTFTFMIKVQPDVAGISQQQDGYSAEELAQGIADNASAIENIENVELLKKADQDGYYEDLTSGTSLAVLGTPTTESVPYLFRRSASIGVRESDKIIGGTVAWNQLVEHGNFDATTGWSAPRDTITVSNNVLSATITEIGNGGVQNRIERDISCQANHVFAILAECNPAHNTSLSLCLRQGTTGNLGDLYQVIVDVTTGWSSNIGVIKIPNFSGKFYIALSNTTGAGYQVGDVDKYRNVMCIDLTQALGSAIADYINTLESGTAGAGIAMLKSWGFLTKDYYAYDSGSLQSVKMSAHKTTGKNFMPFNLTSASSSGGATLTPTGDGGFIVNGTTTSATTIIAWNTESATGGTQSTQNPNKKTVPNGTYRFTGQGNGVNFQLRGSNTENADGATVGNSSSTTVTVDDTYKYNWFRVALSAGTYNNVVVYPMLRYSDVSDATYEPYESNTYPLDGSLELRGIPKMDGSNKLYYDGDTYESDGTVVRKYGSINLGSLSWEKATDSLSDYFIATGNINGIKAAPNVNTAINAVCSKYLVVPSGAVGYFNIAGSTGSGNAARLYVRDTTYADADTFKTAMNGVYLVYELATPTTETADPFHDPQICSPYGTEEYVDTRDVPVPVGHETEYYADPVAEIERVAVQVPVPPSANGTYRLTCVVSGGVPTYSWTS